MKFFKWFTDWFLQSEAEVRNGTIRMLKLSQSGLMEKRDYAISAFAKLRAVEGKLKDRLQAIEKKMEADPLCKDLFQAHKEELESKLKEVGTEVQQANTQMEALTQRINASAVQIEAESAMADIAGQREAAKDLLEKAS